MNHKPRLIVFGLECTFTAATLRTLRERGVDIAAIYLPGPPGHAGILELPNKRPLPMIGSARDENSSVSVFADACNVPIARIGELRAEATRSQVLERGGNMILVACFNRKLPRRLWEAVSLGAYNLHPSLLPELRGPDPLFWTLHEGSGRSGITLHRLSGRFDAGPILDQRRVAYKDGIGEAELERRLARVGATLLSDLLDPIATGSAPDYPQSDDRSSYARFPTADDLNVTSSWAVRRVYNFARGIADRGLTLRYIGENGAPIEIVTVVGYRDAVWETTIHSQARHVSRLRFDDGELLAVTRHASRFD